VLKFIIAADKSTLAQAMWYLEAFDHGSLPNQKTKAVRPAPVHQLGPPPAHCTAEQVLGTVGLSILEDCALFTLFDGP